MKLTKEMIEIHRPCSEGLDWYNENGSDDLLDTLLKVNKVNPSWARWLYTRLMDKKQRVMIAVFSAEQVLHIFENKYLNDQRPRKAIDAAKKVIELDSKENRSAAAKAARAAYVVANAIFDDDYVDVATAAAANAAYAAADAAAAKAARAAYAATEIDAAADRLKMQELIIYEAVRILENENA